MESTTLDEYRCKLKKAILNERSNTYCLRLWSEFIRARDGNRCVLCHSTKRLSAHHIIRKSFWKHLRFQTGNGITLCHSCHKEPHKSFNRKPNLQLPMDAEGGEKIDLFTGFLGALLVDSQLNNITNENFYHFDDHSLIIFKELQGIPKKANFSGSKLEQAYQIWNQTPRPMLNAILKQLGVILPEDYVQDDIFTMFQSNSLKNDDGSSGDILYIRYVPPTSFKTDPNNETQ